MKKLFVVSLLLCLGVTPAQAFIFEPQVTNWSESTENAPDLGFFPLRFNQGPVENIAGGWYAWGTAFEFNLEHDVLVHSIMSPIAVSRGIVDHNPVPGVWNMNLTLFSGTTNMSHGQVLPNGQVIPIKNPVFSQNFVAYGHDVVPIGSPLGRVYTFQGVEDLNLALPSGKYWATYYDGSVVSYVQPRVRLEIDEDEDGDGIVTPEPASLLLLGGGLVGMAWRRKRKS